MFTCVWNLLERLDLQTQSPSKNQAFVWNSIAETNLPIEMEYNQKNIVGKKYYEPYYQGSNNPTNSYLDSYLHYKNETGKNRTVSSLIRDNWEKSNNHSIQPMTVKSSSPYNRVSNQQGFNDRISAETNFHMQYKKLQEEKFQKQLQTQSEAILQQQQTFALRQQLNPPFMSTLVSPIDGASSIYMPINSTDGRVSHQGVNSYFPNYNTDYSISNQTLKRDESFETACKNEIIIHQNHPGLVVNQACQTQISNVNYSIESSPDSSSLNSPNGKEPPRRLKSPIVKRPLNSPVTMCGWLFKQGSDGLKVWRRRWFVLSEYCLYYYKSPEEEKLLGSILLPSYSVSVCSTADKVNRKFAFKCEHKNMRTYLLATETYESMMQWIKALSLACVMQIDSNTITKLRPSENYRNSDSDQSSSSPVRVQPLYVNAPPKPRRAGEIGINTEESSTHLYNLAKMDYQKEIYDLSFPKNNQIYSNTVHAIKMAKQTFNQNYLEPYNYELDKIGLNIDRFDPEVAVYTKTRRERPKKSHNTLNEKTWNMQRPHSADFLNRSSINLASNDYISKHRPKSSLDISNKVSDQHYYSEANYAEKMRQSIHYLPRTVLDPNTIYNIHKDPHKNGEIDQAQVFDTAFLERNICGNGKNSSMKRLQEWKLRMLQSPLTRTLASNISDFENLREDNISKLLKDGENSFDKTLYPGLQEDNPNKCSESLKGSSIKAVDLLNRTHDELVLLLMELKRENSNLNQHIQQLHKRLRQHSNQNLRPENLQLKLIDLEQQLEKNKPILNLVENMVELGLLYKTSSNKNYLKPNKIVDFKINNPSTINQLKGKVDQLYQFDQVLIEKSNTLKDLHIYKETLEEALMNVYQKLQTADHEAFEDAQKHKHLLDRELSKVHQMLAIHSKTMEKTMANNATLEAELIHEHLKHKINSSNSVNKTLNIASICDPAIDEIESNEMDTDPVQELIEAMKKQRENLSLAVQQLTGNESTGLSSESAWKETLIDDNNQNHVTQNHSSKENHNNSRTVRIVKRESEKRQKDKDFLSRFETQSMMNSLSTSISPQDSYPVSFKDLTLHPNVSKQNNDKQNHSFQSVAAKEIITELKTNITDDKGSSKRIPLKCKRRSNTLPQNSISPKECPDEHSLWKSRDDAHVQSSSKTNPPDVVQCSSNISATTIDGLFLTPNKIFIPERYVPEDSPELSPKELMKRKNKVENIKKMLSQTSTVGMENNSQRTEVMMEKKRREHLLQLNQILAQQVMHMSKVVSAKDGSPKKDHQNITNNDQLLESPSEPLPTFQQRENYFT